MPSSEGIFILYQLKAFSIQHLKVCGIETIEYKETSQLQSNTRGLTINR